MLLTVVVADPARMSAIRDGLPTPGRVLRYPTGNLASVFESIRANQPGLIVLDWLFLQTPAGHGFVERIKQLNLSKVVLQAALFERGVWTMKPLDYQIPDAPIAPSPRIVAVTTSGLDTRRAPRYLVQDLQQAMADGTSIKVVDLSVLGAQMISQPMTRPNQKIKLGLPDGEAMLQMTANVAWSVYERPAQADQPHFRAGVEFNNAVREALEDYCKRHCLPDPLPIRR
jgi:hypothetical protein